MKSSRWVKLAIAVTMLGATALVSQNGTIVATGTFHGAAHSTSGRATVYAGSNGDLTFCVSPTSRPQTGPIFMCCLLLQPMPKTTRTF
jgi:hypothetical protein